MSNDPHSAGASDVDDADSDCYEAPDDATDLPHDDVGDRSSRDGCVPPGPGGSVNLHLAFATNAPVWQVRRRRRG